MRELMKRQAARVAWLCAHLVLHHRWQHAQSRHQVVVAPLRRHERLYPHPLGTADKCVARATGRVQNGHEEEAQATATLLQQPASTIHHRMRPGNGRRTHRADAAAARRDALLAAVDATATRLKGGLDGFARALGGVRQRRDDRIARVD